jgi:hypothetical protein
MLRNTGNGAAVGDYDNDGDLDVYLLGQLGRPNRLFRNELDLGLKRFVNVTPSVLADLGTSRAAAFVDLDQDGLRDLVLLNDNGYISDDADLESESRIFHNLGDGAFEDVSAGSNFGMLGYVRGGLSLADYDGDGRIDLYVSNWCMHGLIGPAQFPGSNHLYRNLGGFVFQESNRAVGIGFLSEDSFASIFTDFDRDRRPDLFVAMDHAPDHFYWNRPEGWVEASAAVNLLHGGNDMRVASADFDNDDDLDLYATNITDADGLFGLTPYNAFHVNQQSQTGIVEFVDEAQARGAHNTYWGWGVEFVDVENDGDLDIVAVTGFDELTYELVGPASAVYGTPSVLLLNDGTGHFAPLRNTALEQVRDSRTLIAFDYDRDGDQDLLITNVNQPVQLLENTSGNQGHWLEVRLTPDHRALGAVVRARTGNLVRRRDVICGDSFLAGTPMEVHFGLGGNLVVDTLRVEWAGGGTTTLLDVAADQILDLNPDSPTPVRLTAFTAERDGAGATLIWTVTEATNHAGFFVHREVPGGMRMSISGRLQNGTGVYEFRDPAPPPESVRYWLREISRTGEATWYGPALLPAAPVGRLGIGPNRPNPFRGGTRITFTLEDPGPAELTVLDTRGRRVASLYRGSAGPGEHALEWTGSAADGSRAAPGVYFLHLAAGNRTISRKIVLLP